MTGRLFGPVVGIRASSVFFEEHNVILSNSGTESGVDSNLAIACLLSYSVSCTATLIGFTTDTTALYQTEPRRRLTLHNKMFLVSVWHIQALYNV